MPAQSRRPALGGREPRRSAVISAAPAPATAGAEPLVTIAIPAYNRPDGLRRAVRSALGQRHVSLEVLISDDASPDAGVQRAIGELLASDPRVRAVRQPCNLGHAGNYQWLLEAARGEYFMWLCDDDWLDPDYVQRCLAALRCDRSARLVCGLACYHRDGAELGEERAIELDSARPGLRLLRYFARVSMNGPLFGVARRDDLLAVGFPQLVGGDWLLVAALAARGRVHTLKDVHIHRSATGLGSDASALARSFGLRGPLGRHHHLLVAAEVWRRIAAPRALLHGASAPGRLLVATAAAGLIVVRFTVADCARALLGPRWAGRLERRLSLWLRSRDRR
jgi:hypothetical protein